MASTVTRVAASVRPDYGIKTISHLAKVMRSLNFNGSVCRFPLGARGCSSSTQAKHLEDYYDMFCLLFVAVIYVVWRLI